LFRAFGVKAEVQKPDGTAALGIKTAKQDGWVRVSQVLDGGAGQKAGLSAGDLLAAVDGCAWRRASSTSCSGVTGQAIAWNSTCSGAMNCRCCR
jgi:predicted metalloprotease with PDZ domain